MELIEYLQSHHTEKTVKSYLREIEIYKTKVKDSEHAKYQDVLNYLNDYKKNNYRCLSAIKQYYIYLIQVGEIESHPCKNLKLNTARKEIQLQNLFTSEELELLLERENRYQLLKYRNLVAITFLIYQGLTPENLVRIDLKDIDFDKGTIYIKATSRLRRRTLELKAKQVNYLYKYIYEHRPKLVDSKQTKLIVNKLGEELTEDALNRLLRPLKGLFLERNLNAKTIRQSVISNWINEQGIPLEDVQLMCGHKWLSSTEKYYRNNIDEQKKLINKFFPF